MFMLTLNLKLHDATTEEYVVYVFASNQSGLFGDPRSYNIYSYYFMCMIVYTVLAEPEV